MSISSHEHPDVQKKGKMHRVIQYIYINDDVVARTINLKQSVYILEVMKLSLNFMVK